MSLRRAPQFADGCPCTGQRLEINGVSLPHLLATVPPLLDIKDGCGWGDDGLTVQGLDLFQQFPDGTSFRLRVSIQEQQGVAISLSGSRILGSRWAATR